VELKLRVQDTFSDQRYAFESNQSGIETDFLLIELEVEEKFESNQSGIETCGLEAVRDTNRRFESNQSGIETLRRIAVYSTTTGLNRTKVELKHVLTIFLTLVCMV